MQGVPLPPTRAGPSPPRVHCSRAVQRYLAAGGTGVSRPFPLVAAHFMPTLLNFGATRVCWSLRRRRRRGRRRGRRRRGRRRRPGGGREHSKTDAGGYHTRLRPEPDADKAAHRRAGHHHHHHHHHQHQHPCREPRHRPGGGRRGEDAGRAGRPPRRPPARGGDSRWVRGVGRAPRWGRRGKATRTEAVGQPSTQPNPSSTIWYCVRLLATSGARSRRHADTRYGGRYGPTAHQMAACPREGSARNAAAAMPEYSIYMAETGRLYTCDIPHSHTYRALSPSTPARSLIPALTTPLSAAFGKGRRIDSVAQVLQMVSAIPPKNAERVFLHGSVLYTKPKVGDSPIAFVANEPVRVRGFLKRRLPTPLAADESGWCQLLRRSGGRRLVLRVLVPAAAL